MVSLVLVCVWFTHVHLTLLTKALSQLISVVNSNFLYCGKNVPSANGRHRPIAGYCWDTCDTTAAIIAIVTVARHGVTYENFSRRASLTLPLN